jgi:hypothetical protein
MGETCHYFTLAKQMVIHKSLPFIHVYFGFSINEIDSIERFLKLVNCRRQEENWRSIYFRASLSKQPCHLDRVSLSVSSFVSSLAVLHVLSFINMFVNFPDHFQVPSFIKYSKSITCASLSDRNGFYREVSFSFLGSEF